MGKREDENYCQNTQKGDTTRKSLNIKKIKDYEKFCDIKFGELKVK